MLTGFEPLVIASGLPRISITKNGLSFNKASVEKMERASYVCALIDRSGRRIAIVPDEGEDAPNRMEFFKKGADISNGVRWNSGDLKQTIQGLMGWNLDVAGYRVEGEYDAENRAIIFNLDDAVEIKKNKEGV